MMKRPRCPTCGRVHKRSNESNRLYWAIINEISEQLKPHGHQYSPQSWHVFMKIKFLGAEDIRLPNGKVHAEPLSTTDLDAGEMSDYIMKVEEFATKYGVIINHEY